MNADDVSTVGALVGINTNFIFYGQFSLSGFKLSVLNTKDLSTGLIRLVV